jgi:hypothetical protein
MLDFMVWTYGQARRYNRIIFTVAFVLYQDIP